MTSTLPPRNFLSSCYEIPVRVQPKTTTIIGMIRQINSLPWTYRHHPIPIRASPIRSRTPTEFRLE